jgi:hypothetical protein
MKEIGSVCLTDFKLLSQIGGKSMNNCDFYKERPFCQGVAIVITRSEGQKKPLSLRICS